MKDVFLVEGVRTPQVKAGLDLKDVPVPHLAIGLVRHLVDKWDLGPESIEEVILGNTGAPAKFANIARVVALEAGLDQVISAYCVHRNCASGMEAMSQGYIKIASGRNDLIMAGGLESMSQMPLLFSKELTELFIQIMKAKNVKDRMKVLSNFRFPYLSPVIAIEQGLTDPFCGLNMGQTAEVLSRELDISRAQQDEFANKSHQKAIHALNEGKWADEIVPLMIGEKVDRLLYQDIGPRPDSTVEGLGKMRPYFDKKSGTVTVGNSCPITDGGSAFLMASEEACKKYNLNPVARMVDYHFHGLSPKRMGLGPVYAMNGLLKRTGLTLDQIDLFEINEAFAAQVLACLKTLKDKKTANRYDLEDALGEIPEEKLNVNGGAIALGHPVGSTGSRLVVTLSHELKRRKGKYGLASLCIGGGQGGACLIENLQN